MRSRGFLPSRRRGGGSHGPRIVGRAGACALAVLLVVLFVVPLAVPAATQEDGPPGLAIAAIEVTPPEPGDDTLCQLRVRVENRGERPASALAFEVRLDGRALRVYDQHLFYQKLAPGETSEVRLFNFWSTETDRPRPADGVLDVEVVLSEAVWLEVTEETEEGSEEPVEVWTPAGEVAGLPASKTVALSLR